VFDENRRVVGQAARRIQDLKGDLFQVVHDGHQPGVAALARQNADLIQQEVGAVQEIPQATLDLPSHFLPHAVSAAQLRADVEEQPGQERDLRLRFASPFSRELPLFQALFHQFDLREPAFDVFDQGLPDGQPFPPRQLRPGGDHGDQDIEVFDIGDVQRFLGIDVGHQKALLLQLGFEAEQFGGLAAPAMAGHQMAVVSSRGAVAHAAQDVPDEVFIAARGRQIHIARVGAMDRLFRIHGLIDFADLRGLSHPFAFPAGDLRSL
jgi:hypothetical protein